MKDANPPATTGTKSEIRRGVRQWSLTKKELRETLRDRRTIVTLLAMPVLVYPLLGLGFRFIALSQSAEEVPEHRVAMESDAQAEWLRAALQAAEKSQTDHHVDRNSHDESAMNPRLPIVVPNDGIKIDLEQVVANGNADIGVRVQLPAEQSDGKLLPVEVELIQRKDSLRSRDAADIVRDRLHQLNLATIRGWARQRDRDFQIPLTDVTTFVKSESKSTAILGFLPLILLLMTVTGGVYPAIDLTAGERERDTLETLMALPIPRMRFLWAKFVAVVTVTLMTGMMNLIAMTVTMYALQLETSLFGDTGVTWSLAGQLLLVLTAFALFYSSLLLVLTSSARSFKEAQAYLIPLLLLTIAPGFVIVLPGWELNGITAVVPMVNMLLLARGVFEETAAPWPSLAAVISTLMYATVCLSLAARVFGTDSVTTGSQRRWGDLWKRPTSPSAVPAMPTALFTLALLFPVHFVASGLLSRTADASIGMRLSVSAMLTTILFLVLPGVVAWWQRVDLGSGLRLRRPGLGIWFGVLLLGTATWPWVFEAVVLLQSWGVKVVDPTKLENVEALLTAWRAVPLPFTILALGVLPGLCEEVFFRGFLFSGLRRHLSGAGTVIATAVAFGVFHVILAGGAAPERLLPSTMMGLLLGWVSLRADSILPSIGLHVTHNSLLLTIARYREELSGWNVGASQQDHLPLTWLAASAVAVVIGVAWVFWTTRGRSSPST